jgi:4-amino-4-deoxy-L-arabinose transferase-like glycosyltransferase
MKSITNTKRSGIGYFILGWTLLNILQAFFTELGNDEAYYWMYSRFPAWGYFDHPPFIAWMISPGYLLFPNELGVRLIAVFMSSATVFVLWKTLDIGKDREAVPLFFMLLFSIVFVHLGGFMVTPDVPLVFFTALFLYYFKKYQQADSWQLAMILAAVAACLVYSKYHGILVLTLVFLSDLQLVKRKSFWLLVFMLLVLLVPHAIWQIENNFETFRYHLYHRSRNAYELSFSINYLLGQLLLGGPLAGFLLFYVGFKTRAETAFEKTLKYVFMGFFIFFFLSTFKGKVEENWTVGGFVALTLFSFPYIFANASYKKWVRTLAYPSVVILLFARLYFVWDFFPASWHVNNEFAGSSKRAAAIEKVAGNVPVVFMNSYSKPAKYSFYTGKMAYTLNNFRYRKNQYNLWDHEERLQHRRVLLIPNYYISGMDKLSVGKDNIQYVFIDDFFSLDKIRCQPAASSISGKPGEDISLKVFFKSTYKKRRLNFCDNKDFPVFIYSSIFKNGEVIEENLLTEMDCMSLLPGQMIEKTINVKLPEKKGKYELLISLKCGWLPQGLNGDFISLEAK